MDNSIACHEIHPPTHFECMRRCLRVLYLLALIMWLRIITPGNFSKCFLYVHENCLRKEEEEEDPSEFGQQLTYPHLYIDSTLMEEVLQRHISIYIYIYSFLVFMDRALWLVFFSLCAFTFISWSLIWFCSSQWSAHLPRLFERLREGDG